MPKKIISNDTIIVSSQYITEGRIIQHVAYLHGYDITIKQAIDLWIAHSDRYMAQFLVFDFHNYDKLWKKIKPYFEKSNTYDSNELTEMITSDQKHSEYEINFNLEKVEDINKRYQQRLETRGKVNLKLNKDKILKFRVNSITTDQIQYCLDNIPAFKNNKSKFIRNTIDEYFHNVSGARIFKMR